MALCSKCNTETGDARFCPSCGTMQEISQPAPEVTTAQPVIEPTPAPVQQPEVVVPTAAPAAPEVVHSVPPSSGSVPVYAPDMLYTVPMAENGELTGQTGQMVFAIVNIALGVILCCCGGYSTIVSLVLGIIALIMVSRAKNAMNLSEAQEKMKTAKILNIIGVVFLGLGLFLSVVLWGSGLMVNIMESWY